MEKTSWNKTAKRFVAFFDILGFKDFVLRNDHAYILKKLELLKEKLKSYDQLSDQETLKPYKLEKDQTKSVTFSDSIIFFSKSDTKKDLIRIIYDASRTILFATENNISIKGALSFGEITVDFENSLFFGQPIIDAFLLHEELQMITAVFDNNIEVKLNEYKEEPIFKEMICDYKTPMKSGRINHKIIRPKSKNIDRRIDNFSSLYNLTSGRPRIYIDNTLEFFKSLKQ